MRNAFSSYTKGASSLNKQISVYKLETECNRISLESPRKHIPRFSSLKQINFPKSKSAALPPISVSEAPPLVTAQSWSICDSLTGNLLWGKEYTQVREMASLTKIMTAFVVVKLISILKINPYTHYLIVSNNAASTYGTSGYLKQNHKLTVYDLLHALLLPSGNDAAVALAEGFGSLIIQNSRKKSLEKQLKEEFSPPSTRENSPDARYVFMKAMNRLAKKLGLTKTSFANPHGLADKGTHSNAQELGKLASIANKNTMIHEIVNKKSHRATAINLNKRIERENKETEYGIYYYYWKNTNRLLEHEDFCGMKTGETVTAGSCLIGLYNVKPLYQTLQQNYMTCPVNNNGNTGNNGNKGNNGNASITPLPCDNHCKNANSENMKSNTNSALSNHGSFVSVIPCSEKSVGIVITVLACKGNGYKFKEVYNLAMWASKKIKSIYQKYNFSEQGPKRKKLHFYCK